MQTIENDLFKAEIDEQGAQLTHLYQKTDNYDYIWNNEIWPKHAPVLFPAIGRSNNDSYLYNDATYQMPQHGFVSSYTFQVISKVKDAVTLQLTANSQTLINYPFNFTLSITFKLKSTGLHLQFNVINNDDKDMSFSLGSHPAFNVPIDNQGKFTDYQLEITPQVKKLSQFDIIKKPYPFRNGTTSLIPNYQNGIIKLNYQMFQKGLIIIENPGLKFIKLTSHQNSKSIQLSLHDFRYVCLWTKEDAHAPFLCIEPFEGLPDIYGEPVNIMQKEGNDILSPGETKVFQYEITIS